MKTSTSGFLAAAAFAVQLVAATEVSDLIGVSLREGSSLERRQAETINLDDIPAECKPSCTTIVDAYNTCTTTSCLCSSSTINGYASCLSCLYGPTGASTAQSYVNELVDTCIASGESATSVSVSGAGGGATSSGGSSGTSFTAPGGGSATGSGGATDLPTSSPTGSASSALESLTDIFGGSSFDIPGFSTPSGQTTRTPTTSARPSAETSDGGDQVAGGGGGEDGALTLQASAFVGVLGAMAAGMLLL